MPVCVIWTLFLGRDDRLVDKLASVAEDIDADFAAIIGTPVPAVIATDYRGLRRLAESVFKTDYNRRNDGNGIL